MWKRGSGAAHTDVAKSQVSPLPLHESICGSNPAVFSVGKQLLAQNMDFDHLCTLIIIIIFFFKSYIWKAVMCVVFCGSFCITSFKKIYIYICLLHIERGLREFIIGFFLCV